MIKIKKHQYGGIIGENEKEPSVWNTATIARLASIPLDLASLTTAQIPGYGTAVSGIAGVGSTVSNFVADVAEGNKPGRNLVNNLAMDALGLVPVAGASSKISKTIKTISNLYKIAIPALSTLQGISNFDEYKNAWDEVLKGNFD